MTQKINSDEKFVYIDGRKYPVDLWGEKYGKEYGDDYLATSLSYYHKKTMKMLLKFNIVQYHQPPDGIDFTCKLTPNFISYCRSYSENFNNELGKDNFYWDDLLKRMAKEHKIRLGRKLLHDMVKLILFIDKYGKKGQIWIK